MNLKKDSYWTGYEDSFYNRPIFPRPGIYKTKAAREKYMDGYRAGTKLRNMHRTK